MPSRDRGTTVGFGPQPRVTRATYGRVRDEHAQIAGWNRQAEVVFGWSEAAALGRHFALIVPEPALVHVDPIFQALAGG